MSQGSDLDKFVDFALGTREHSLDNPTELISQASRYRTHLFRNMLGGWAAKEYVQAGSKIVTHVQFSYQSTYSHYNPTDSFAYTDNSSLTRLELPWRFTKVSSVISQFELLLQNGDKADTFIQVKRAKENARDLDWWEGNEDSLWRKPNFETMEKSTLSGTGEPYSVRCFITRDGLAPSSTNGGVESADFSTLLTANPALASMKNFRNQVSTFVNTNDAARRDIATGVIPAMDEMYVKTMYRSPSNSENLVTETTLKKQKILCNLWSHKLLTSMAKAGNNVLTPRSDIGWANGNVVYHGTPVEYIDKLNFVDTDSTDFATYPNGTAADGTAKDGFKWWFVNFNHFMPVFHKSKFRDLQRFQAGARQPNQEVLFEDTWWNIICKNRREQGLVVSAA